MFFLALASGYFHLVLGYFSVSSLGASFISRSIGFFLISRARESREYAFTHVTARASGGTRLITAISHREKVQCEALRWREKINSRLYALTRLFCLFLVHTTIRAAFLFFCRCLYLLSFFLSSSVVLRD